MCERNGNSSEFQQDVSGGIEDMKEKMNQVAKGIFEYEAAKVFSSEEKLEFSVEQGKTYRGSLTLSSSEHRFMKGVLYSTDALLTFPKTTFTGEEAVIEYEYKAAFEAEAGEQRKGNITVITNFGEYVIPFEITIIPPFIESRIGKIHTLDEFVELVKTDMMQGIHIYKTPEFRQVILSKNKHIKSIYTSLMKSPSISQSLEEFLIAIHKKKNIILKADEEEVSYEDVVETVEDSVIIRKDEWGYLEAKITTDVDFLVPRSSMIWAEDFVMDEYSLVYKVDESKLKAGCNLGHISIVTATQVVRITIKAYKHVAHKVRNINERKVRHFEAELTKKYLAFRMNKITKDQYVEGVEAILRNLIAIEPRTEYRLWMVHLDMVARREDELGRIMNTLMNQEHVLLEESVMNYLAYLYLKALYTRKEEDIQMATQTIREYRDSELKDWKLLWYLMYVDHCYEEDSEGKLKELMEEFKRGVTTPVLYFEACLIYNKEPQLLQELGVIEQRILHWGIREGCVNDELIQHMVYLAGRLKTFQPKVLNDLCMLYERTKLSDCLQMILRMLISGQKAENKYFAWYQMGIREQIKVTELYEYYMYAIDEETQEAIDQPVLLYFIYNNHLSEQKKAYLYAYLIRHKEELYSIYKMYQPQIISFAKRMINKGAISWNLTTIYKELLVDDELEDSMLMCITSLLFRNQIICKNLRMAGVVVVHEELKGEECVPFVNGQAMVTILSEDAQIYLLDEWGNRYMDQDGYILQPMMNVEDWYERCYELNKENIFLLLYRIKKHPATESSLEMEDLYIKTRLLEEDRVSDWYKGILYASMLKYYAKLSNTDKLEDYLHAVRLEYVDKTIRYQIIEYYIMQELYDFAYAAIQIYGYEEIAPEWLVRLLEYKLEQKDNEEYFLQRVAYYLFQKKQTSTHIVAHLADTYIASTKVLYDIWKVAKEEQLDTTILEERLLGQMVFCDEGMEYSFEVFESYYHHSQNKSLVRGYLNDMAYRYLVKRQPVPDALFELIERESFYHESKVCMLALLYYYSRLAESGVIRERVDEETLKLLDYNLHKYIGEGVVLPFFKEYRTCIALPETLYDRQFAEYIANPKNEVYIHYRLQGMEERNAPYITERMENVYEGIRCKAFLLFQDESIQYYITEETKEGECCTELRTICQRETPANPSNRYGKLNLMYASLRTNELEQLEEMMKQYITEEYVTTSLFKTL